MTAPEEKKRAWPSERIEPGIRIKANGYEAYVKRQGRNLSRRFPLGTHLDVIRAWRQAAQTPPPVPSATWRRRWPEYVTPIRRDQGYCYIYFVSAGGHIKVGRTVNPYGRFKALQAGSSDKLKFLGAVAAHQTLELMIHNSFAAAQVRSEWFHPTPALRAFIRQVVEHGKNPVQLLWEHDRKGWMARFMEPDDQGDPSDGMDDLPE